MFNVEVNEFSSPTDKLLKNIEDLLKELLGKSSISFESVQQTKNDSDFEAMGRAELLEFIKTLPKGSIKGKYMTMKLDELRKAVKEAVK